MTQKSNAAKRPAGRFEQSDALHVRAMCMCLNARSLARDLTNRYDAALRPAGLRMTQFIVLAHVRALGGAPTAGELAAALELDQTTASRSIRLLHREGWVTVSKSGRHRIVSLTAKGEGALEAAYPLWQAVQARATASVGGEAAWLALKGDLRRAAVGEVAS